MKYAISSADVSQSKGFYSQATTAGRLIFISGQTGIDKDQDHAFSSINQHSTNTQVSLSVAEQTENIIAIFMKLLDEVNCTLSDIAQLTIFVTSLDYLPEIDAVLQKYFDIPAPARNVAHVCSLPDNACVEIGCIACR